MRGLTAQVVEEALEFLVAALAKDLEALLQHRDLVAQRLLQLVAQAQLDLQAEIQRD